MIRALDTSGVVLPGVSTPRLLGRLGGMLLMSFPGASLTGYAAFAVIFLEFEGSLAGLATPWNEGALGMFFWPFVIFGTLWAWCWTFATLQNRRWFRAGCLIIPATVLVVIPLTPVSPVLSACAGYAAVALGCVLLGRSKVTALR